MQSPSKTSPQLPPKQKFATTFRTLGRISYWIHIILGVASAIALGLIGFSRNYDTETSNIAIGFSLFLSVCSLIIIGFRIYWDLRYRQLAKRLQSPNRNVHPKRAEVLRVLRIGLFASLGGLLMALIASEISVIATIARAIAQPQGVTIYGPEKFIKTADLFLILANINILGAHFLGSVNSLGLLDWLSKE